MANGKTIRIGGASGFWGESDMGLPQFLAEGGLDYVVFDYLAEITMSIMARARAKDPELGYAGDFVSAVIAPNLAEIAKQGVKIISNAGGVNPEACGRAVRAAIEKAGVDLTVAVVTGDDLSDRVQELAGAGHKEMFTGAGFPDADKIASANAYLGAFPVADALERGADIVITGRCVDSAVTLGACIHSFGWKADEYDKLAGASLAGHIIECGPQATGGNHTDWETVADSIEDIGYPIAEIGEDGNFQVSKPAGTGGAVTVGTVGEQMLYEIGDPQAYFLPDVVCDFSEVTIEQAGTDLVSVAGTKGRPAPDTYKVCATYADGWRLGTVFFFVGDDARAKSRRFADAALKRARRKLEAMGAPDYEEVLIETHGDESHYGDFSRVEGSREIALKMAVKHQDPRATGLLLREATGLGLATPPGLSLYSGSRPKPSPVVRLFSFLLPKGGVPITVTVGDDAKEIGAASGTAFDASALPRPEPPSLPDGADDTTEVPLVSLAFGRSGDKGDKSNIGILPRKPEYAPWIWDALTEAAVAARFAHFIDGDAEANVDRFFLPGTGSINFLIDNVLGGGGVASLRNDPQGKCYAQLLLQTPVRVPRAMAESLGGNR